MSQILRTTNLQSKPSNEEYHEVVSAILKYIEEADKESDRFEQNALKADAEKG